MPAADDVVRIAEMLREVSLFATCTNADLLELAPLTESMHADAGDQIVHEGSSDASQFFVIVSGEAKVEKRYRKVASLTRGDFFGELALLVDRPRNCTVTAVTDLELLSLDRRAFLAALEQVPRLAVGVASALASRLSAIEDTLL